MSRQEADRDRPDLSQIEPLRSVAELEDVARPGMTDRERAREDHLARDAAGGGRDTAETDNVELPPVAMAGLGPTLGASAGAGGEAAAGGLAAGSVDEEDLDRAEGRGARG